MLVQSLRQEPKFLWQSSGRCPDTFRGVMVLIDHTSSSSCPVAVHLGRCNSIKKPSQNLRHESVDLCKRHWWRAFPALLALLGNDVQFLDRKKEFRMIGTKNDTKFLGICQTNKILLPDSAPEQKRSQNSPLAAQCTMPLLHTRLHSICGRAPQAHAPARRVTDVSILDRLRNQTFTRTCRSWLERKARCRTT